MQGDLLLHSEFAEMYGHDDDMVACAPLGTVAPAALTDLADPFSSVGWLSEDGISWEDSYDKVTVVAHQGGVEIIEVTTKTARSFKFQCLEETALQLGLRYPGFVPVETATGSGIYGGEVPTPISDPRVWVVDTFSISNPGHRIRRIVPKGQVSEVGTLVAKRGEVSIYEYTVKVLEGRFFVYGNSAGLAPASP